MSNEDKQNGQKAYNKLLKMQQIQIKTKKRYRYIPTRMAKVKEKKHPQY